MAKLLVDGSDFAYEPLVKRRGSLRPYIGKKSAVQQLRDLKRVERQLWDYFQEDVRGLHEVLGQLFGSRELLCLESYDENAGLWRVDRSPMRFEGMELHHDLAIFGFALANGRSLRDGDSWQISPGRPVDVYEVTVPGLIRGRDSIGAGFGVDGPASLYVKRTHLLD